MTKQSTKEFTDLTMAITVVGPLATNAYLLRCRRTGAAALIDAGAEPDALFALDLTDLRFVITTHRHPDHWQALADVVRQTGAQTVAHPLDAPGIPQATDMMVPDGTKLEFGTVRLDVIHLPGHTPGSICLQHRDQAGGVQLWTGDALFPGGVGNTHGNADDFRQLLGGVEERLFDVFPDDTQVYPGHGPSTTLGAERPHLTDWWARGW